MKFERVVFTDHDGTLTDSTYEMVEYSSIVREYNAKTLGMHEIEITQKLDFDPPIVGGAKKYEVNRDWTALLPTGPFKGFEGFPPRGVELQRQTFYETLKKEANGRMGQIVFVEDVAEFVLWLDFLAETNLDFNNVKTALVLTPMTPVWERNRYTDGNPSRFGSESLLAILEWMTKE